MTAPPIVLLTDFGLSDAYVGMMRGVIHGINPAAHVIDLTHGIGPQDVRHGAVVLADSCRYFPTGSVFVAVVDPGVGTDRAAILLETPDARFVAPDNGLLTLVCRQYVPSFGDTREPDLAPAPTAGSASSVARPNAPVPNHCRAWRLTNPDYWQHPVSATFLGRDVFAPVAAHLSAGASADALGESTSTITALSLPIPQPNGNIIRGQVIFADAFGNLVTNITADLTDQIGATAGSPNVTVTIAGQTIIGLSRTFHDPPGHGLSALIGSHGRLEIAIVDGSAAATLGVGSGAPVVATAC
ncbi:MAG: SAM-dependent chlorinase/fluorinase [Chloroflexi bacterium]|nr:SAM-dependent chlorinase/fluorinase [Chloroflexota bacterium]